MNDHQTERPKPWRPTPIVGVWLNFNRWTSMHTRMLVRDRFYLHGWQWTPIVVVRVRPGYWNRRRDE